MYYWRHIDNVLFVDALENSSPLREGSVALLRDYGGLCFHILCVHFREFPIILICSLQIQTKMVEKLVCISCHILKVPVNHA